MTTPIKAARATILLGDIEVNVFQLPDGSYRLSQSEVCVVVSKPPKRMVELSQSDRGQSLVALGFEKGLKLSVEGSKPVTHVSLEVAFQFWVLELSIGNIQALALVSACGVESVERRADAAFGKIRTEQERNERFITRRDSILSRNFWTDCIDEYAKTHVVSDNYKRWIYIHVSNYLNKHLFGMTSKEIREHYDIGENSPRDYFPSETLRIVDAIEKTTALRVRNTDCEPLQTLKDMVSIMGVGRLPL